MRRRSPNIWIERNLLASKAYHDLDGKAAKVLMWFLMKRQFARYKNIKRQEWVQTNNGEINFTYDEASVKHGYSSQVFSRLLDDLVGKGFINVERLGSGPGGVPSLYKISDRWRDYGVAGFKAVKRPKRNYHSFPKGKDHPIHRKKSNKKSISQL